MKPFDKFLLGLGFLTTLVLAIIFLPKINSDLSASLGVGAATFFGGLWVALIVVFWLTVGIVALVASVKIWHQFRTQVIRDSKDGQAARVVIHGDQLVQIAPGGMDISEIMKLQQQQILQMQNYWKMLGTATTSMKNMTAYLEQLEVVDAIEGGEGDGTLSLGPVEIKQIAPPRTLDPSIVTMHLTDNCAIPADDLLSGRKLIAGISGSGKSNTVGTYGEELGRLRVPFVMGDTEDEYQPLCNQLWLPNGVRAGLNGPYKVTVENAAKFGAYVLDHRLQVILNLHSYEMEEAALVMIGIINGMREWEEQFDNEDRIPCDFILEEAVTWLPQNIKESPLYGTDTLNILQSTFFNDMVRKGRKRGLGLTIVCQKIAELDKRAMQSDGKILHRQTEPRDLECYQKFGIPKEVTTSLGDGECFLFTSHVSWQRVQIRRRQSPHGGKTPGIANLRKSETVSTEPSTDEFSGNAETTVSSRGNSLETPPEANSKIIDGVFPDTTKVTEELTVNSPTLSVSNDIRETIRRMKKAGKKDREISKFVGLSGRKYGLYQTVLNELGLGQAEPEEEGA